MTGWRDRVVADSADRESWLARRAEGFIGASDAAGFAKEESVDRYILAKLKSGHFSGNRYTDSGNFWEPEILAWFGIPRNTLFVHSAEVPWAAATPDGIEELPTGEIVLAEVKAIHGRVHRGPTLAHLRQIWWAQFVFGATRTKYAWRELMDDVPRRLEPHIVIVDRDDKQIEKLLRIARSVHEGVMKAREFERSIAA